MSALCQRSPVQPCRTVSAPMAYFGLSMRFRGSESTPVLPPAGFASRRSPVRSRYAPLDRRPARAGLFRGPVVSPDSCEGLGGPIFTLSFTRLGPTRLRRTRARTSALFRSTLGRASSRGPRLLAGRGVDLDRLSGRVSLPVAEEQRLVCAECGVDAPPGAGSLAVTPGVRPSGRLLSVRLRVCQAASAGSD